MASLSQLQADVAGYLNRSDFITLGLFPGWVSMLEVELAETLRSRCQVVTGIQNIDATFIALPSDFATMESIRDNVTGEMLVLKDQWSGHWFPDQQDDRNWPASTLFQIQPPTTYAYRIVGNCIEWLPHPVIPDPPDPTWVPQQVLMGWYQKPVPLLLPTDTNVILEQHYGVYLYGLCKTGAIWALDDPRAAQMDAQYQQVVTRANLWKQSSDYSGAPFVEELAVSW
jgi:hypothetical protein